MAAKKKKKKKEEVDGYLWYSFGSAETGQKLGKALGFAVGKKTPRLADYGVVAGWGCKPGSTYDPEKFTAAIASGKLRLLNHPDAVEANRDKLGSLKHLAEQGIAVPGFLEFEARKPQVAAQTLIPSGLAKGQIAFPVILLSQTNRGDPIFCYTEDDVGRALTGNSKREHPLVYARSFEYGDEFRVHVFRDHALFAQRKKLVEDPVAKTVESLMKRFKKARGKGKKNVSAAEEATAKEMAELVAVDLGESTANFKRSVAMGWEFLDWELELVPPEVTALAVEALDVLQLDMGAVSVSYVEGVPRVLSVTTAPKLANDHMAQYVKEIRAFAQGREGARPVRKAGGQKDTQASHELISKVYRKMRGLPSDRVEKILASLEAEKE